MNLKKKKTFLGDWPFSVFKVMTFAGEETFIQKEA